MKKKVDRVKNPGKKTSMVNNPLTKNRICLSPLRDFSPKRGYLRYTILTLYGLKKDLKYMRMVKGSVKHAVKQIRFKVSTVRLSWIQ